MDIGNADLTSAEVFTCKNNKRNRNILTLTLHIQAAYGPLFLNLLESAKSNLFQKSVYSFKETAVLNNYSGNTGP
jgi:hypothetical protein